MSIVRIYSGQLTDSAQLGAGLIRGLCVYLLAIIFLAEKSKFVDVSAVQVSADHLMLLEACKKEVAGVHKLLWRLIERHYGLWRAGSMAGHLHNEEQFLFLS